LTADIRRAGVDGAPGRYAVAVLLLLAAALWWHRWVPALLMAGFVAWVILHRRLEDGLGAALASGWQRAAPPASVALVLLAVVGLLAYWTSHEVVTPKVLPVTLNGLALAIIAFDAVRPHPRVRVVHPS
jgi:hypothetical protein